MSPATAFQKDELKICCLVKFFGYTVSSPSNLNNSSNAWVEKKVEEETDTKKITINVLLP